MSDGHYKVLVLGGSPSGANTITISPNDQDKLYFVYNNTSQNAIFSQGSGANATVLAGDFGIVYADGAGAGAAATLMTFPVATADIADGAVTSAKILDGTIATADLADDAITSVKIADDAVITAAMADNAVTSAIVDHDVQTKSGTTSVTLSSTAVSTYVKHSGTGTLSIGAGQYDGQTINITTTGTMTLSWHGSSQGVSLGSSAKIASGVYDSAAGYWFFSETVV